VRTLLIEPGPNFSVADVHRGLLVGLAANGVTAQSFNLGDRLSFYTQAEINGVRAFAYEEACRLACQSIRAAAWDWGPDIVIVVSSFFVPPEVFVSLRNRGVHVVLWCTESPYEDERQIRQARYADTVILNDPINIDEYRQHNPRTYYVPHGYDPALHHADGRTDEHPFSFVGTGYASRIEFLEKAELPAGSVLAGNWQQVADDSPLVAFLAHDRGVCIDNADTAALYRASACSFNLYRKEAMSPTLVEGWAMGPRECELAATGTFFAREPRGEGDGLFPFLPQVTEPGELADVIRWAQDNPNARRTAAARAREAVADRSFAGTVAQFLRHIGA